MTTLPALRAVAAIALFSVASGAALAASTDDLIKDAQALKTSGRVEEAAARFGAAIASAQKKGDLLAEQRAARGLFGLFDGGQGTGGIVAGATGGASDDDRNLMALVLGQLDAKRNGAFVSAPALARRLLFAATELGDSEHATSARAALKANGKRAGMASAVLARYADGLISLRGGKSSDAETRFRGVLDVAQKERWADVAAHVSAEIAGIRIAADDTEAARAVLAAVADNFDGELGSMTSAAWMRALRARVPDVSEELLRIVSRAVTNARPTVGIPLISDGGFGKSKSTDLGRAMKRFSKRQPLVTVACAPNGFAFERHFDEKRAEVKLYRPRHQRIDYGGLLLVTRGRTVALRTATTENAGASGIGLGTKAIVNGGGVNAGAGSIARADYLLARDEVWTVTKAGVVTVK